MVTHQRLSRNLPWFDGHFPARPVLPGVALLALLQELLRTEGRELAGFARLRFRQEVVPDDEIAFESGGDDGSGTVRFTIKRVETVVADGLARVRQAGSNDDAPRAAASAIAPDPALPPIDRLLPHRGAMRLLDGLVVSSAEMTIATASIDPASPIARGQDAASVIAIEIAAQAAAAGESLARFRETGVAAPREGRLVGASDVAFHTAGIPLGCSLTVSIVLAHCVSPMSIYESTVAAGDRVLMTGRVSTYLV